MGGWRWSLSILLLGAIFLVFESMSHQLHRSDTFSHQCKILVWNAQGARSRDFLNVLRGHIHIHKLSIVALVETRVLGARAQAICEPTGFRNNFCIKARGFQGEIWVLWNSDELDIEVINSREQFVMIKVHQQGQMDWLVTFVYASPHTSTRDSLWPELQQLASEYHRPWLLAGDFNETSSLEEWNHGGPEILRKCQRFKSWIANTGLIDLGYSGPKFTWARGLTPATRKEARLDRALCNVAWCVKFQEGTVRHLLQACSDHSPLLISTKCPPYAVNMPRPFRFQVAWTKHSQFEGVVASEWHSTGSIVPKTKQLALTLTKWNKEVFGNLFRRKRNLWSRIEGIQKRLAVGAPSHLLKLERRLRHELEVTLDQIADFVVSEGLG